MQLSKYFKLDEMKCKCGCKTPEHIIANLTSTSHALDILRDHLGPLLITSGYRCKKHNDEVGGASESLHIKGLAADVLVINQSSLFIAGYVSALMRTKQMPAGGVGTYSNKPAICHVDIRGKFLRWHQ